MNVEQRIAFAKTSANLIEPIRMARKNMSDQTVEEIVEICKHCKKELSVCYCGLRNLSPPELGTHETQLSAALGRLAAVETLLAEAKRRHDDQLIMISKLSAELADLRDE